MQKSICFVIPKFITFATGGAELQVYLLSEEFLKRGWKVEVLSLKSKNPEKSKYYNPKIKYYQYNSSSGLLSFEFFKVLFKLFRTKSNFYYQRTDYPLTGAVAFYCKLTSKKMIYALAHDDDAKKNKYSSAFSLKQYRNKLKGIIRLIDRKLLDKMVEFGKKKANAVICQTLFQQEQIKKYLNLNTLLIRNSYIPNTLNNIKKENIILWVANFRDFKQPELFLKLATELELKDWKFVMIGNAQKKYLDMMNKIDKNNFKFLGHLSYDQANSWFEKSKILVNTSIAEGFSNTFIQSWFYKCLIISLNANPDQLLTTKQLGLVANNDFMKLKQIITDITDDFDKYSKMISEAFKFASDEFDINNNVNTLEKVISDL